MVPSSEWIEERLYRACRGIETIAWVLWNLDTASRRDEAMAALRNRKSKPTLVTEDFGGRVLSLDFVAKARELLDDAAPFNGVSTGPVRAANGWAIGWAMSHFEAVAMVLCYIHIALEQDGPEYLLEDLVEQGVPDLIAETLMPGLEFEAVRLRAAAKSATAAALAAPTAPAVADDGETVPIAEAARRVVMPHGFTEAQAIHLVRGAIRRKRSPIPTKNVRGRLCVQLSDVRHEMELRTVHRWGAALPSSPKSYPERPSRKRGDDKPPPLA